MSVLINVNLYIFKKSNDLYLYFVIQIKSKIDLNHYSFFIASMCLTLVGPRSRPTYIGIEHSATLLE